MLLSKPNHLLIYEKVKRTKELSYTRRGKISLLHHQQRRHEIKKIFFFGALTVLLNFI